MRKLIVIMVAVAALLVAAPASAHGLIAKAKCSTLVCRLASQKANLKHARYLCNYGRHQTKRWGCSAVKWLTKEKAQTEASLNPWGRMPIRTYVEKYHPCLAQIIALEDAAYDPTLDYGGQHGHVNEPYGIGQANPGTKMAPYGSDWATNPWTQLRWMIGYTVGKFGSECAARDSRVNSNSY